MLVGLGEFLSSRRRQIVQSVALHKIPTLYIGREYTEADGTDLSTVYLNYRDHSLRLVGRHRCLVIRKPMNGIY